MRRVFHRLLKVLAGSTRDDLRRQVQFLKAENEILRSRLSQRVRTTPGERDRLIKLGRTLRAAIKELITVVSPKTFLKWVSQGAKKHKRRVPQPNGRPPTPEEVRQLVVRIAHETDWGYVRILGELRKLGIRGISATTVSTILKEHGIPPGPARGRRDLGSVPQDARQDPVGLRLREQGVWTARGLVDAFVLVFIHVASRRVWASPSTTNPDGAWVAGQARAFAAAAVGVGVGEALQPGQLHPRQRQQVQRSL